MIPPPHLMRKPASARNIARPKTTPSPNARLSYEYGIRYTPGDNSHLGGPRVDVRKVDGARSEVDDGHGDALRLQSGKLVEVHPSELESVDEVARCRTTEFEDEIVFIEGRGFLLQMRGTREGVHEDIGAFTIEPRTYMRVLLYTTKNVRRHACQQQNIRKLAQLEQRIIDSLTSRCTAGISRRIHSRSCMIYLAHVARMEAVQPV